MVVTLGAAAWGYRRGPTVGAVALLGFGGGAVLGSRVAPLLLDGGVHSTYAPILALPAALLFGGLLAALLERLAMRWRLRGNRFGRAGSIAGALLCGCLGLIAAWMVGSILAQVGSLRDPLARSEVLKRVNAVLPELGPVAVADVTPPASLPTYEGPVPQVGRPDPLVAREPKVRRAGDSVVKIQQTACGHDASGSGWVAAPGVVVTNAHVVAGASAIQARLHNKTDYHDATPIWLDRKNDLAVLRVEDIRRSHPLPLAVEPRAGTRSALLGYPLGRWAIRPIRLGPTTKRTSGNIGEGPGEPSRKLFGLLITTFAGQALPGNSGGPIVDAEGRVVATVFGGNGLSGVAVPNEIVRRAVDRSARKRRPVGTGSCLGEERD